MTRRALALTPVALLVVALTACGGGDVAPAAGATSTTSRAPAITATDDPAERQLLLQLEEVDPALADERSINRAKNVCLDLNGGKEQASVLANTKARFEGGSVPTLTDAQVKRIVAIAKATVC